jgi:adenylate cyclase
MVYRWTNFELDMDRFELRKGGAVVPVEPQVFALLALLVTNHDRMVSKAEIHERIWSGRVVSDAALNSRIRSVRQALGDDGAEQRVIRTLRSNGFRFVADVAVESRRQSPSANDSAATASNASRSAVQPRRSAVARPTVAVLPFANLSDDPDQEYFSDAVAGDIISMLSRHRWLHVLGRNTTFGYKGRAITPQQLARDLDVAYVVEGTVRRAGNGIRVTAALVDAESGVQLWADRYDRDLKDVFAVQDEITERVAARLEPEIGFAERQKVARSDPRDLQAWE